MVDDEDRDEGLMWHTTGVFFLSAIDTSDFPLSVTLAFIFYTSGAMTGMHIADGPFTDGRSCLFSAHQIQCIHFYHVF
jgi:hypothetical protein